MIQEKTRFLKVKDIQELEHCGRDAAYSLARKLPHEQRGKDIYVFREAYEDYYEERKQKALERQKSNETTSSKIYSIKKFQTN